jgi:O-antigen/teichoic acid export membrane protein
LTDVKLTASPRTGLRAAATNFGWLLADHGVRFVLSVVVGLWVARYLGASGFGELQYALTLIALVSVLGEAGVESVVKRQLIATPDEALKIIGGAVRLRLLGVGLSTGGLALAGGLGAISENQWGLLLILVPTLLQPVMGVPELWLHARLQGRELAWPRWIALGAGAVARVTAIVMEAPVAIFALIIAIEIFVSAGLIALRSRQLGMKWSWSAAELGHMRETMRLSLPLLLSGVAAVLYMKIDVVMLQQWQGAEVVGLYSAAVRLSEITYFLPAILATSVLPALLRAKEGGRVAYMERFQRYFDLNGAVALGLAVMIVGTAPWLMRWGFGANYLGAIPVLQVHAWALPFVFLGVARTQYLVDEKLGWFYFGSTGGGAAVNVALNLWLIPTHGAMGAAIATVISYAVAGWISSWWHPKVRSVAWAQTKALAIPVLGWRYFRR